MPFRTLTDREKQLIAPYVQRVHAAKAEYELACSELARVTSLMEPKMGEPGVEFDPTKMAFFQRVDGGER